MAGRREIDLGGFTDGGQLEALASRSMSGRGDYFREILTNPQL
jgi:hypothetical protein